MPEHKPGDDASVSEISGRFTEGENVQYILDHTPSNAIKLATAASLAARIEPELIRAIRLRLYPAVDVSAEIDLWISPLVQARSPSAIGASFRRCTLSSKHLNP